MADPESLSSAAQVYAKLVPQPLRTAAGKMPPQVRRKVKKQLKSALASRESRLHQRALRKVRESDFSTVPEGRTEALDGRVGHVHTGLTPDFARRADLGLVTAAFDLAGIPWFAVPALDDRRITLAVPQDRKTDVRRVLRALLEEQTGYVVSVSPSDESTANIPGSHIKAWKHYARARVIRVMWLRTDPTWSLWVGENQGVEIEFWTHNTALETPRLVGPRPNRVQRVVPAEAAPRLIPIGHERLSGYADNDPNAEVTFTREGFDVQRVEEISYPVDAVVLWQNSEPWAEELLRATLRSIHQYAPWIDVIHLVASRPVPGWVQPGDRLQLIGAGRAVDPALQPLPGAAARFLLLRPGALFARPVRPFDYFTPLGGTRPRRGGWSAAEAAQPWTTTAYTYTGRAVAHGYAHGPQPHTAEILGALGDSRTPLWLPSDPQYAPELPGTHPVDGVAHHAAHVVGLAEPSGEAVLTVHAAMPRLKRLLERLLVRRDAQQFHLMGLGSPEGGGRGTGIVIDFLRRYYPVPSPYEAQQPGPGTGPEARDEDTDAWQ